MQEREAEIQETTSSEVVDLDSLGFGIDNESIMTSSEDGGQVRDKFFSSTGLSDEDLNKLPPKTITTKDDSSNTEEEGDEGDENSSPATKPLTEDELNTFTEPTGEPSTKANSETIYSALNTLVESGDLLLLDEDKELKDYTNEDIVDMLKSNIHNIQSNLVEDLPNKFFGQLPIELQQAYNYVANGGTDMKSLFNTLAASEEIKSLDISNEGGQIDVVRSFLQATQFGTPEEIEDEIIAYQDRGDLEAKAKQFKPKLDKMGEEVVNQKLAKQAELKKMKDQQAQQYQQNIYDTLSKAELGGIKINSDVQNLLYNGLLNTSYPSVSGKQTNLFGYLIEKYQYVEPRHDLIAEALWLLSDENGYRESIRRGGVNEANEKVYKELKTLQQSSNTAKGTDTAKTKVNKVSRVAAPAMQRGFFSRNK